MSAHVKNYYIGDPRTPHRRGQNEHGMVHCLVWGMIYAKGEFFAKKDEHAVGIGGSGIGRAKTIPEARKLIHTYAVDNITEMKASAEDLVRRCEAALSELRDDPNALEQYSGSYNRSKK